MMSTKASTLQAPSSKLQADEGVTVLKVPYKSSKQAEERLLRLVNEGSLSEFPHEYYTPEEDRPVLSRKALAESSAPCLVISHTKSSWWRSALGTDKLKVLPVSQISSIVIGQESPVFVKALRGGFKLPAPDHCLTIHTRSRTLDFILPSAEQCTALKQELQTLLPNQVPPVVATAKQTIARPAPALPPTPLQDMRNKSNAGTVVSNAGTVVSNAGTVVSNAGAVVDAGAWTDARRQAYLASAVLQHIESDAVADLAICLDDGCSLETRDSKKRTLLFVACDKGASNCTRLLLLRGAQFDPENEKEDTALHVAVRAGSIGCVKEILKVSTNTKGHTELILGKRNAAGDTPLHIACTTGNLELVELLAKSSVVPLLQLNAKQQTPLNALTQSLSAQPASAHTSFDKAIQLMLDLGADETVDWPDVDGRTALHYCVLAKSGAACKTLLEAGADPRAGSPTALMAARKLEKSNPEFATLFADYVMKSPATPAKPHSAVTRNGPQSLFLSPLTTEWRTPVSPLSATSRNSKDEATPPPQSAEGDAKKGTDSTAVVSNTAEQQVDAADPVSSYLLDKLYHHVYNGGAKPWTLVYDESYGCYYFYNQVSGESTWEPNQELLDSVTFAAPSTGSAAEPGFGFKPEAPGSLGSPSAPPSDRGARGNAGKGGVIGGGDVAKREGFTTADEADVLCGPIGVQGDDGDGAPPGPSQRAGGASSVVTSIQHAIGNTEGGPVRPRVPPPPPGGPPAPLQAIVKLGGEKKAAPAAEIAPQPAIVSPPKGKIEPAVTAQEPALSEEETTAMANKYIKMLSMGVPLEAVLHRCKIDSAPAAVMDKVSAAAQSKPASSAASSSSQQAAAKPAALSHHDGAGSGEEPPNPTKAASIATTDPKFAKYMTMKKLGVPLGAIKVEMMKDGLTSEDIQTFLLANASAAALETMGLLSPKGKAGGGDAVPKTPGPTLKLHWDPLKIPEEKLKDTIWGRLSAAKMGDSGAESHLESEDLALLTSLFAAKQTPARRAPASAAKQTEASRSTLLDMKRANNLNIALAQFKRFASHAEIISSVYRLDSTALPRDLLDKLARIMPTTDEQKSLRAYKGPRDALMECDRFFYTVLAAPRFPVKVASFITLLSLEDICDDIRHRASVIKTACNALLDSENLRVVLAHVLTIGNTLNQGHSHLTASAISLDSLLKLPATKSADRRTTLLDALAMLMVRKLGSAVFDLAEEFTCLTAARRVELNDVRSEYKQLCAAFEAVKKEVRLERADIASETTAKEAASGGSNDTKIRPPAQPAPIGAGDARSAMLAQLMAKRAAAAPGGGSEHQAPVVATKAADREPNPCPLAHRQMFCDKLTEFTARAQVILDGVHVQLNDVEELCRSTVTYFGEDAATTQPSKVFGVLQDFLTGLVSACSTVKRTQDAGRDLLSASRSKIEF